MIKTLGGKVAKVLSVAIAAVLLFGCTFLFTACESKRPEITVRISFRGEEYNLRYQLYRNLYSQTVAHYIELIDLGYYDNTVIHDYQGDRIVGGGYTYTVDGNVDMSGDVLDDLTALDYDGATKDADGNVTLSDITVWKDSERTVATNRLHGEIASNGFSIDNDTGLSNTFGALGTYSYVSNKEKTLVTYKQSSRDGYASSEYYKNSTTSMFYIYTSTSAASASNFCVFGKLADTDSETALNDLLTAISEYQTELELDSFTDSKQDVVIRDEFVDGGSYTVDFSVPVEKVIIEEMRVVKY